MTFPLSFIEGIGGPELMLIMFVVLLLFGANKLPELARGFGKSMREFKKAASGVEEEVRRALEEEPAKPKPPAITTPAAPSYLSTLPDASSDLPPEALATEQASATEGDAPAAPKLPPASPDKPTPPAAPTP